MAFPITFSQLAAGAQPLSDFDTMFNTVGTMGVVFCTATGTNTIALTPNTNMPTVSSYTNYQAFGFVAAATATGGVTLNVNGVGAAAAYAADGVTQLGMGNIVSGSYYIFAYNSAISGFQLISATSNMVLAGLSVKGLSVFNSLTNYSTLTLTSNLSTFGTGLVIDNVDGNKQCAIYFNDAGSTKWSFAKQSNNTVFSLLDNVNSKYFLYANAGGSLVLGPSQNFSIAQAGQITQITPNGSTAYGISNVSGSASYNAFSFSNSNGIVGAIVVSGTATAYNTTSDKRLKSNVAALTSVGAKIDAIQPVTYTWTYAEGSPAGTGFLAQDLLAVIPEAVTVGDAGVVSATGGVEQQWSVDYSKIVPYLVAELQACRVRIAALENKVMSV